MYLRWYYNIEIVKIENNVFSLKMSPKYKMYLNDYISKRIQGTVGRYVRWGKGMGVIFLITNRINKQIIPQAKVWIINVIIKYLAHLMYLRWYYTIEIVKIENKFFFAKNVPKYKMYLNDYISKRIQGTVGRYVRWGKGMGVIFLITNRVNKQIIPQTKVWIINVIIKYFMLPLL